MQAGKHTVTTDRAAPALIGRRHALGHAEIDADHFAIADAWGRAMQCAPIALPFHVARLRKLMRGHFDNEAALVEAAGTEFCVCHRREHDTMLALCDDVYALSERNPGRARSLLRRRMPPLVRAHIDGMDQITVLIIGRAKQDRAAVPGRARE